MTGWEEARAANLANWNDRVPIHTGPDGYMLEPFAEDATHLSSVVRFDAPRVGDVRGLRLLHLQCHIGTDTVSWARLGAEVTGLDFSAPALEAARTLARTAGVEARFVEADVHDAVEALDGETFDVVYTGVGAINWLPSAQRWARVAAGLVAPGGRLYLREMHPMLGTLDEEDPPDDLRVRFPYFETDEPLAWDAESSYTGTAQRIAHSRTYEWPHGLGEVLSALLDEGLRLVSFEEHRFLDWAFWPWMERTQDGGYVLPAELRDRIPLQYSLLATREGSA